MHKCGDNNILYRVRKCGMDSFGSGYCRIVACYRHRRELLSLTLLLAELYYVIVSSVSSAIRKR
jgi:hypothetical protein